MADLPPKYDPIGAAGRGAAEETNDPLIVDARNFYKVEKWTKDGSKVDHMLYAEPGRCSAGIRAHSGVCGSSRSLQFDRSLTGGWSFEDGQHDHLPLFSGD